MRGPTSTNIKRWFESETGNKTPGEIIIIVIIIPSQINYSPTFPPLATVCNVSKGKRR
jgi:hypothetical protein